MKIRKISILLTVSIGAIVAFSGCSKDDGAIPERVSVTDVPAITTNIDPTGSQSINLLNLASFSGKFKVDLYFPGTTPPSKVDIVVRRIRTGAIKDTIVKVYQAGVTSLPATYTVTAAEIATLFGTAITLGDTYDFAPDIYVGDRKFEAFPAVGVGTGAGVIGMPLYGEFARYAAICKYDPDMYVGNFVVVSDAFGDFAPGEIVPLTKIDRRRFSFIDPYATNPLPIIVIVDTLTNRTTVTKQKIGDAFTWDPTLTNPNAAVANSASSFVAPCSQTLNLAIAFTADQATNGFVGQPFLLKLIKQ